MRGSVSQVVWTTIDQGLASIVSFGLVIVVANANSARDFGTFALVQAFLIALTSAYRTTIGTVVLTSSRGLYPGKSVTTSFTILPMALLLPIAALVWTYAFWKSTFVLAILGALLYLFAGVSSITLRFIAFQHGVSSRAALFSACNAVGLFPAMLLGSGHWTITLAIFGASSSTVLLLVSVLQRRGRSAIADLKECSAMIQSRRRELSALGASFFSIQAVALLPPIVVAASSGLDSVAGLRGAQTLMTAGTQVPQGLQPLVLAKSHAAFERQPERVPILFRKWLIVLVVCMFVFGLLLLLVPPSVGGRLLGESWLLASTLFPYAILEAIAAQWAAGLEGQFRAIGATRVATRIRMLLVVPTLVLIVIFSYVCGVAGTLIAMGAGQAVLVILLSSRFRRAFRDRLRQEIW